MKISKRLIPTFFKNVIKRSDVTLISLELPPIKAEHLINPALGISFAAVSAIGAIFESYSKKFTIGDISMASSEHTNLGFDLMLSIPLISAVYAFMLAVLSVAFSALKGGILND
jgi:hypothetical protein